MERIDKVLRVEALDPTARSIFWNGFWEWLPSSFGLALLPLFSRLIVDPHGSLEPELCLFILVLGATGVWEAHTDRDNLGPRRSFLVFLACVSALYGALGYGKLAAGLEAHSAPVQFETAFLLWPLVVMLSLAYFAYKVPVLRGSAIGQARAKS